MTGTPTTAPPPLIDKDLLRRAAPSLLLGLAPFVLPVPEGLDPPGFQLLGIFVGTIVAFVTRPAPMGPIVLVELAFTAMTGTVAPKAPADLSASETLFFMES